MNRSCFLLVLCFSAALAAGAAGGTRRPVPAAPVPRAACTQGGTSCSEDCSQVVLCIDQGDGTFVEVPLQTCAPPQTCSQRYGNCSSTELSCQAAKLPFVCTGPGYFPDPFDCTKYHVCLAAGASPYSEQCDSGWAYDPLTTACSLRLTSRPCVSGPLPQCYSVGQNGVDPENPSIYYVCVLDENGVLVHRLYRCEYGWTYNPSTYQCVETVTTTSTTSSPTSSTTTVTPPCGGNRCDYPGLIIADDENCHRYYLCNDDLVWVHCSCVFGTYYSRHHHQCVIGLC